MENKITPTRVERKNYIYGPTRAAERTLARSAVRGYNTSRNDGDDLIVDLDLISDDLTDAFDIELDNEKLKARFDPFS